MRTSEFDRDTAVRPCGDGAYGADLSARWSVGDKPNGGYLMALAARALARTLGRPDPLVLTAHYARALRAGPATVVVEALRTGRRLASGHAVIVQDGRRCVLVAGTFTALAGAAATGSGTGPDAKGADLPAGLVVAGDGPPPLPDPDDCLPATAQNPDGSTVPLVGRLDMRLHPGTTGWAGAAPTGRAEVGGWIRLADGREPDPYVLPLVVDSFPPTVFDLGYRGWVPTIELTVHTRARPAPGWLRCWIRSRLVAGGYVEEDAEVWDSEGKLVAMARQLALVPGEPGA